MNNKNMTALVSAFARAYHTKNSQIKIYSDCFADRILSEKEYNDICKNMADGIFFFNPDFQAQGVMLLNGLLIIKLHRQY